MKNKKKLSKPFSFRVTSKEKQMLQRLAKKEGITLSELIRKRISQWKPKKKLKKMM